MRKLLLCFTVLCLPAGCLADPLVQRDKRPGQAAATPELTLADVEKLVDQRMQQELSNIRRDFTSREMSVNMSNSLGLVQTDLEGLEAGLEEVRRTAAEALNDNPGASQQLHTQFDKLALSFEQVQGDVLKLVRDVDSVAQDNLELRREILSLIHSLQSYRDAYELALHTRRNALQQELDLLDRLLSETSAENVGE